ncbi:DinB family protein [Paenibacillus thalictri]|uniref:DinB family protein n=1 Tax=Paenibacillus thalictri TaxID=2527873 RepID=A0A4V2J3W0_9BACL|nr:DinB family protein [Paenibacillus thalictri]TBL75804.1 DinB family protein [Paenibacillus thalictri]
MSTTESLQRLEDLTNHYIGELDGFSMEQLTQKASEDDWSLGQMYVHLINTALYMQLRNIEVCRNAQPDAAEAAGGGGKSEMVEEIFAQGALPAVRVHVPPSPQYTPGQPESKEQLAAGMRDVLSRVKAAEPGLAELSPQQTAAHPRFGRLNATEWFLLVEMHYRHHLMQKERLKSLL